MHDVRTLPALAAARTCANRWSQHRIPFAKPGRDSIELEIFGMAGVPEGMEPGDPAPAGTHQSSSCKLALTSVEAHATADMGSIQHKACDLWCTYLQCMHSLQLPACLCTCLEHYRRGVVGCMCIAKKHSPTAHQLTIIGPLLCPDCIASRRHADDEPAAKAARLEDGSEPPLPAPMMPGQTQPPLGMMGMPGYPPPNFPPPGFPPRPPGAPPFPPP